MALPGLLVERRGDVLARWRALVLERTVRPGTSGQREERDPFRDPIGLAVWRATAAAYDLVCGKPAETPDAIEELVRVRSVQEVSPSEAVGFVFLLRPALREVLGDALERAPRDERATVEERLDGLALQAFEAYVRSREKLFDLRAREVVSRSFVLLERARRLVDAEPRSREPATGGETP